MTPHEACLLTVGTPVRLLYGEVGRLMYCYSDACRWAIEVEAGGIRILPAERLARADDGTLLECVPSFAPIASEEVDAP